MATRGRRYLSVTLETLLDDPQLLRHAPAPTATGVYHLETLNLETILMNSHKVSFAEPHRLWQAVLTGGVPSCHRWEANQFRLFLHSGAYWLLHQLRQAAPRRSLWRKATFETLRRTFLKIAVRIEELKSRVRVALPSAYPYQPALMSIAARITAQGP